MNRIDRVKRWLSMYDDNLCRGLSLKVLTTGSDGGKEVEQSGGCHWSQGLDD